MIHEESWSEELYSRDIVTHLKTGFHFLLPYYDYLQAVEAEPDPAAPQESKKS